MPKKEKIINIIGKGIGWEKALEDNLGGEVWGVNDVFFRIKCDKTFHMHDLDNFLNNEKTRSSTKLVIEHANDKYKNMPIYTVKPFDKINNIIVYPLDEIVDKFGVCYFACTIDYMIAYAIESGATTINLYGCNMSVKEEYKEQKPSMEFWTGVAVGRGIKVNLQHQHTSLFKTRTGQIYGYLIPQWIPDSENKLIGQII